MGLSDARSRWGGSEKNPGARRKGVSLQTSPGVVRRGGSLSSSVINVGSRPIFPRESAQAPGAAHSEKKEKRASCARAPAGNLEGPSAPEMGVGYAGSFVAHNV